MAEDSPHLLLFDGGDDQGPTHGVGETKEYSGPAGSSGCSSQSDRGFDCSGLVKYAIYQALGISLGHSVADDADGVTDDEATHRSPTVISSVAALKPGDVVIFGASQTALSHDGIYTSAAA